MFKKLALIGIGLIGSSIARAAKAHNLVETIAISTRKPETLAEAQALGLGDIYTLDAAEAVRGADLVILCTPVGAYEQVMAAIGGALMPGAILSDVGSVKEFVHRVMAPHVPKGVHLIPAHPIAGTEHSGPAAGFAELFIGRWCVLTPEPGVDPVAVDRLTSFWGAMGSRVEVMSASHHDMVLAITSHVPHLIAYNIVGTVADLEKDTQSEVIKFSASGFRDFTRIAASDPVMWRDVFLTNRDAVLEMLGVAVVAFQPDQLDAAAGRLPARQDIGIAIGAHVVGEAGDVGLKGRAAIIDLEPRRVEVVELGVEGERREALGGVMLLGNVEQVEFAMAGLGEEIVAGDRVVEGEGFGEYRDAGDAPAGEPCARFDLLPVEAGLGAGEGVAEGQRAGRRRHEVPGVVDQKLGLDHRGGRRDVTGDHGQAIADDVEPERVAADVEAVAGDLGGALAVGLGKLGDVGSDEPGAGQPGGGPAAEDHDDDDGENDDSFHTALVARRCMSVTHGWTLRDARRGTS